MPARRSGCVEHHSASHRLWARRPARRSSNSAAPGEVATSPPIGKNGGMVLGYTTSATTPSASRSAVRRALSQFRSASSRSRSPNGFTKLAAHRSKSS